MATDLDELWNQWNIRSAVMLSFFLQIFLILFAPLRKRTSGMCLQFFTWLAYLSADFVAIFAIGLIVHSRRSTYAPPQNMNLLTFWASFLLLHLGGPDTITAFAIEDNTLWFRHLIGLVFQVLTVLYVLLLSFSQNNILVPTILIFVVGVGKYGERTRALYLAGSNIIHYIDTFRRLGSTKKYKPSEDAIQLQSKRAQKFFQVEAHNLKQRPVSHIQIFKMALDAKDAGDDLLECLCDIDAETAYGFLSLVLNIWYMELYTKGRVALGAWVSIFRMVSFIFYIISLVLFTRLEKHDFKSFDVDVTYTLLLGAIALDAFAFGKIIFSDGVLMSCIYFNSILNSPSLDKYISFLECKKKPPKKSMHIRDTGVVLDVLDTPIAYQRWSASIYAYNLLSKSLEQHPRMIGELIFANHYTNTIHDIFHSLSCFFKVAISHFWSVSRAIGLGIIFDKLGISEVFDTGIHVSSNPFIKNLWKLIYDEVREKSLLFDNRILDSLVGENRGEWVLFETFWEHQENEIYKVARECINNLELDESLIVWHIATEVCYNTDKSSEENRVFAKVLSDYMFYIMVKWPETMSKIPGTKPRIYLQIHSTVASYCAETVSNQRTEDKLEVICKKILDDQLEDEYNFIHHAGKLARKLKLLREEERWNIMTRVWIEMLSYIAIHSPEDSHFRIISKGGELLTFVKVLMEMGFHMLRQLQANGPDNILEFGKGLRTWTKEKEEAFQNNIQHMKEIGLIGERGLTPSILYKLAENCSVSLYDIVLRLKCGDTRDEVHDTNIQH